MLASQYFSFNAIPVWATVVALLIVVAGILAVTFRNARTAQSIKNWRELAESYEAKSNQQEGKIAELQHKAVEETRTREAEMKKKDIQISNLQERVSTLQEILTGRAAFEELSLAITGLVSQLQERTSESLSQMNEIRSELRGISERIRSGS